MPNRGVSVLSTFFLSPLLSPHFPSSPLFAAPFEENQELLKFEPKKLGKRSLTGVIGMLPDLPCEKGQFASSLSTGSVPRPSPPGTPRGSSFGPGHSFEEIVGLKARFGRCDAMRQASEFLAPTVWPSQLSVEYRRRKGKRIN